MDIYLYHFNNYYNRRLKLYPAVEDYEDYEVYRVYSVNFNPNDGVITEHVIGADSPYNGTADYAIIIEDNQIISRWFIIENQRIRGGQHRLVLKRDTVADFAAQVLAAPCFVEKGWVPDSDSAIFNSENMTYNQIKKDEILLKDSTRVPWLVGYYTKSNEALSVSVPQIDRTADVTVNGIENWLYYDVITKPKSAVSSVGLNLTFKTARDIDLVRIKYNNITTSSVSAPKVKILDTDDLYPNERPIYNFKADMGGILWTETIVDKATVKELTNQITSNADTIYNFWDDYFPSYVTIDELSTLKDIIGSTIFDSDSGKTYKVNGTISLKSAPSNADTVKKVEVTSSLGYELYDIYSAVPGITGARPTKNNTNYTDIQITVGTVASVQFELEELNYGAVSATINPSADGQTLNSPFNIFAIPFGELRVIDGGANVYTSETLAMRTAMALIEQYSGTSGVLHDLQLLPYCPIQEIRDNVEGYQNPRLNIADIPGYLYSKMTSGENTVGYIFNCPSTSAKFSIKRYINIKDYKIENETQFCRLVSPNWNGVYEFSPAKNRGLEAINVDLELKPFNPYIHLAPQFNESGLYGKRDGDPIGLICGGDFGLTMISDAWATYERQNKNYQNIFDRQIQNLEVQHKYARIQDIVGATVGTAQGAASGAILGSMIGGVGAGIGAGVGGIASALGGVADYQINEQLRSETMDYTKDLFGYQLGNVKALPDSLTKVNSFNPNNTIFPILEFYGCTDEETEALKNKIKYNGMSIGRIGALKDFINPSDETYVKGQLILLDIEEDSHIVNDISAEIYKGVRI